MAINIPQPTNWNEIENGNDRFPSLFVFTGLTKARAAEEIGKLSKAPRTHLAKGDGPNSYEEAHRVFSSWYASMTDLLGVPQGFIRWRGKREVERLRAWATQLLKAGISPTDYLKEFLSSLSWQKRFDTDKLLIRYALAESTVRSVTLKVRAKVDCVGTKIDKSNLNRYEGDSALDPSIKKSLLELPSFEVSDWSTEAMIQIDICAKALADGTGTFISKKMRPFAEHLAREKYGWSE